MCSLVPHLRGVSHPAIGPLLIGSPTLAPPPPPPPPPPPTLIHSAWCHPIGSISHWSPFHWTTHHRSSVHPNGRPSHWFLILISSIAHLNGPLSYWFPNWQLAPMHTNHTIGPPSRWSPAHWSPISLKFDGWPREIIGHLFYTTSSFVHHFESMGEFKMELQSGNVQFGSKSAFSCPVWPWKLTMTLKNNRAPLLYSTYRQNYPPELFVSFCVALHRPVLVRFWSHPLVAFLRIFFPGAALLRLEGVWGRRADKIWIRLRPIHV